MPVRASAFRIFGEGDLGKDFLDRIFQSVRPKINGLSEQDILQGDEEAHVEHIASVLRVEVPDIHFDRASTGKGSTIIYPDDSPSRILRPDHPVEVTTAIYRFPFDGNPEVLRYAPLNGWRWTHNCWVADRCLCFETPIQRRTPKDMNHEWQQNAAYINDNLDSIRVQVDQLDQQIRQAAHQMFQARKKQIMRDEEFLLKLEVPFRRRADLPQSFAIPGPSTRRKVVPKPPPLKSAPMDPSLGDQHYGEILHTIHEFGKAIEKHPHLYADRDESTLRDFFLVHLEPRFEGSTTAETFNAAGKTDILMKYQGHNVFVAECKVWGGPQQLLGQEDRQGDIDQLLSYLTWRDSKTALMLFVPNQAISRIIASVKSTVPQHPAHVRLDGVRDQSWLDYQMHLVTDPDVNLRIAVMLFHFPQVKKAKMSTDDCGNSS